MKLHAWAAAAACVAALAACGPGAEPQAGADAPPPENARAAALAVNAQLAACDRPADAPVPEPQAFDLGSGVTLLQLPCAQGAYQESFRFFVLREGEAKPELVSFVDYEAGLWHATAEAFTPQVDAAAGVLTTLAKAAGHGGCGSQATYRWDGVRFVLQEMRARGCADLPADGEAVDFPVVWSAPQDPAP